MKTPKRTYRCPDGRYTSSTRRYLREWNGLMKSFAKALNLKVRGFDPTASFWTSDHQVVNVPLSVLRTFNERVLPHLPTRPLTRIR